MKTILYILYFATTGWAIVSVIFHGSRPTKSLSWVLAVIAIPLGGPLLYYLFGVNRRKFKIFKLKQTEKRKLYNISYAEKQNEKITSEIENHKVSKLTKLIRQNSIMSAYSGNKIQLLHTGEETFESIFEAIDTAKSFVHLQYYIIEEGIIVDRFYELFKKKIAEGVEIRMLYDSLGSFFLRGKSIKRFRDLGVKAYSIMPLRFGNLLFTLNYRNHRKIIVIDGQVGYTGGVNISDKYIKKTNDLGIWGDFHLKLKGPIVQSLHRIFIKDYHFAGKEELLLTKKYLPDIEKRGDSIVQMAASGPDSPHPAIMQQYIAMINLAEKRICIANPYFIPGVAVLEALKIAALTGVEVNLLLPRKSDSLLARLSMFANFEQLLDVGVNIYLRNDFSHSKVIVIDDEIASVGSGNFDYRSFEHNFEANAILYDSKLAKKIACEFDLRTTDDILLDFETFKKRSVFQRFLEGVANFFSPLL